MSGERECLPYRRRSESFDLEAGGLSYRVQITCAADGRPLEIFLDGPKIGSSAQIAAHDAAVAASLALQHGVSAETLHHALQKLSSGQSAGPLGRAFDLLLDPKASSVGGVP